VRLPFAEFQPVFRAKTLTDGTKLDPSGVSSVQLMLSKCAGSAVGRTLPGGILRRAGCVCSEPVCQCSWAT